jgi:HD-like signal output (HDOD) protein/ActR/RegA family two-component response regulator
MAKRRILFVDDEQHVLDGLRNLFRKERHIWDMTFATSGKAALEELGRNPVDVIVSDMRMPGMDGADLLFRVKELYPQVARIVLSGHADREAIARVVSVAHQCLSKPCDPVTVRAVIERTCEFQRFLQDDGLRKAVGSLGRLPSLPGPYLALTEALQNPHVEIAEIVRIVESDPAMAVKVLQVVNSAYFGLPQKTQSLASGVTYLGIENLKSLLLTAEVFGVDDAVEQLSLSHLRDDAVAVAVLARRMVRVRRQADAAFAAGLMHDIGRLLLARDPAGRYAGVLRRQAESKRPLSLVEKEMLGVDHASVGAYLLGVWGLPIDLVETVAFHHSPGAIREGDTDLVAVVHLANGLVLASQLGQDPLATGLLDEGFLARSGWLAELPKWQREAESLK